MNLQKLRMMSLPFHAYYESSGDDGGAGGGGGDEAARKAAEEAARAEAERKAKEEAERNKGGNLSDTEAKLLKEVMEKKEAIRSLQEKMKQLEEGTKSEKAAAEQLKKQIEELGDLEEIKKMLQERKQKEQQDLEAKGEWERLKKQMAEEHEKAKAELAKQLEEKKAAESNLQAQIHELTVGRAFSDSTYIRENVVIAPAMVRSLLQTHFDVVDGKVVGFDKPRGSKDRTPLVGENGNHLGFDAAIEKIITAHDDAKTLLKPKGKPGSGSGTGKEKTGNENQTLAGQSKIAAALKARQAKK